MTEVLIRKRGEKISDFTLRADMKVVMLKLKYNCLVTKHKHPAKFTKLPEERCKYEIIVWEEKRKSI